MYTNYLMLINDYNKNNTFEKFRQFFSIINFLVVVGISMYMLSFIALAKVDYDVSKFNPIIVLIAETIISINLFLGLIGHYRLGRFIINNQVDYISCSQFGRTPLAQKNIMLKLKTDALTALQPFFKIVYFFRAVLNVVLVIFLLKIGTNIILANSISIPVIIFAVVLFVRILIALFQQNSANKFIS